MVLDKIVPTAAACGRLPAIAEAIENSTYTDEDRRETNALEAVRRYRFHHSCKDGQYSSAKVYRSVQAEPIASDTISPCAEDYRITWELFLSTLIQGCLSKTVSRF